MPKLLVKYDSDCSFRLKYAKSGDVGLDLPIKILGSILKPNLPHLVRPEGDENDKQPWLEIPATGYAEIETGIRVKLPDDAWATITARSSTAWKRKLMVYQAVIDSGYVGYLRMLVYNPNNTPIRVHGGDRLAQLIVLPKYNLESIEEVEELPNTERGSSGFGSSGK